MALTELIESLLQRKNILYKKYWEEWPSHFGDCTDVWIVGGDGTLNYFINKYPDIQLPLVIFPGGSGNDFHWMLYGNQTTEETVATVLTASPQKVDAGKCNERLFFNCTGAGFDGVVVKNLMGLNKKKGKGSFFKAVIKNIFTYREQRYLVQSDGVRMDGRFLIVSIMNGRRAGGGFYIAPQASVTDSLLDVTLIDKLSVLKRLLYLPVVEKGKHAGLSFVHQFQSVRLTISCDQNMDAQLDGEYFSSDTMEIEILPGKFLFRY